MVYGFPILLLTEEFLIHSNILYLTPGIALVKLCTAFRAVAFGIVAIPRDCAKLVSVVLCYAQRDYYVKTRVLRQYLGSFIHSRLHI